MATACIRAETVARLVELLAARLTVQVLDGLDERLLEREAVVIGPIEPVTNDVPTMKTGRKARDDTFDVTVFFRADMPGQATAAEARARVQEFFQALDDICADDPGLTSLDGVLWAQISQVEGPDVFPGSEGWQAAMSARVTVNTRLA